MTSASSAHRTETCPGSAVLPHVEHVSGAADAGSTLHEHIVGRARRGVDDAVAELDEVLARWGLKDRDAAMLKARLLKFEWSPPIGAIVEIRLALMPDGSVIRVPEAARNYPGAVITGQFDVLWAEPEPLTLEVDEDSGATRVICPAESILWVLDLKGGTEAWVQTIEANFQVAIYGLLAARWTGAKRVMPAILYPGPGEGEWDAPARPWGEAELQAVETRIHQMFERVEADRARLSRGEPLSLTEGRHCEYCPAAGRCPAKIALLKSALSADGEIVPNGAVELSREEAARGVHALAELQHFTKRLREALEVHVGEHGPIDLGDGLVWGPKVEQKTKILPGVAREVLATELGEHAATAIEVSGSSIERAVREKLNGTKGVDRQVKRIYAKIGEAGGLLSERREVWTAHRPAADAPPPPVRKASLEVQLAESVSANDQPFRMGARRRSRR